MLTDHLLFVAEDFAGLTSREPFSASIFAVTISSWTSSPSLNGYALSWARTAGIVMYWVWAFRLPTIFALAVRPIAVATWISK